MPLGALTKWTSDGQRGSGLPKIVLARASTVNFAALAVAVYMAIS